MQRSDLEPVTVDPAKLRRTAWVLVAIMLAGGFLIISAYEKMAAKQAEDNRPAIIHQIRKERDLTVIRQDGKTAALFDLRGKVVLVNCISLTDPGSNARSMGVMQRLAGEIDSLPDFHLVSLVIDPPPAGKTVALLNEAAKRMGVELPGWWFATTEQKTIHRFVKNELKASIFPHQEEDVWKFDTSLFLIDRDGHLRRAVIPQKRGGRPYVAAFDFDQAAEWDAKGIQTGTEWNNEQQLEKLLRDTIDLLLAETDKES